MSTAQAAIKALFARRRLRIYPPDFGNSTAMVSIPLDDVQQAVDSLRTVLHAVGYRGIFSGEFKRDPRDGRFKLLEINTRPWWFIDFAVRCGVDVCRMAYDDALGAAGHRCEQYKVGATCVFPYYDFFAVQPMSGRRTHVMAPLGPRDRVRACSRSPAGTIRYRRPWLSRGSSNRR